MSCAVCNTLSSTIGHWYFLTICMTTTPKASQTINKRKFIHNTAKCQRASKSNIPLVSYS